MEKNAKGVLWKTLRRMGVKPLPLPVQRGLKKSYEKETPFMLLPVTYVAKKIFGEKAVNNALYKGFQRPTSNVDIGAGQLLQKGLSKLTGGRGKDFFTVKKVLTNQRSKGSFTGGQEYLVPSALAPVSKAGAFGIPLLGAMKLDEMMQGDKMDKKIIKEADLKKTAEILTALNKERNYLKKEAKATELLYKQAELGQIKMPTTFAEHREKVAQLLGKNLEVMEEAIKIASSAENELGGLDNSTPQGVDARTAFRQAILD